MHVNGVTSQVQGSQQTETLKPAHVFIGVISGGVTWEWFMYVQGCPVDARLRTQLAPAPNPSH